MEQKITEAGIIIAVAILAMYFPFPFVPVLAGMLLAQNHCK